MRKKLNTIITLSDEQKKEMMNEIKSFYLDVRGEEMGIIEQMQIVDLFVENLAPIIYNKALDDVHRWYKQYQENIESDYYSLYKDYR